MNPHHSCWVVRRGAELHTVELEEDAEDMIVFQKYSVIVPTLTVV